VTPHAARKARRSAIDSRTARHHGHAPSRKRRKRIGRAFGRTGTAGGMAETVRRGPERVRARFIRAMTATSPDRPACRPHEAGNRQRPRMPFEATGRTCKAAGPFDGKPFHLYDDFSGLPS
jgi:hypothetical protein